MGTLERADGLTGIVIHAGFSLHRDVGPGLIESVYEQVLADRRCSLGLKVDRQKPVNISIVGKTYSEAFRYDLLIENLLLIELPQYA